MCAALSINEQNGTVGLQFPILSEWTEVWQMGNM